MTLKQLRAKRTRLTLKAQGILDAASAAERDLTAEEQAEVDRLTAEAEEATREINSLEAAAEDAANQAADDDDQARAQEGAPAAPDVAAAVTRGIQEERARAGAIRRVYRQLGLDEAEAETDIDGNLTADQARVRAIDLAAETASSRHIRPQHPVEPGNLDETDTRRRLIANAIRHRANPRIELEDGARQYRGLNLVGMARECLEACGVTHRGLSPMEIASAALNTTRAAGMHSTSDFPLILADVVNISLRQAYDEAPTTYRFLARQTTAVDFRDKHAAAFGEAPNLEKVGVHGEYKHGTIGEGDETYKVETYGKIIAITRKAIVNDQLDAFSSIPMKMGAAASRLEADTVIALITANPNLRDGSPVFGAARTNLTTGPGTVITKDSVGVMRSRMRIMTGLNGTTIINVIPRFILVPAALETVAESFVATNIVATTDAAVIPESMKSLVPLVEPRLDASSAISWYLFADPNTFDSIEYAFLEGEAGPVTESRDGFEVDGVEIKIRHDFGAGWVDFRGAQKNDGV